MDVRSTLLLSAMSGIKLRSPIINLRTPVQVEPLTCLSSSKFNRKERKERAKVIVISGPTAVGKSSLALELARRIGGEIISADSVQVYRGLDVGASKPLLRDRQDIRHHLLDISHPTEEYSAGKYFIAAREATENVLDEGHVPIVVGGAGLYLRWYLYGKPGTPEASSETTSDVLSELRTLKRKGNWDAAVKLLLKAGDMTAHNLKSNDWYRIQRGLEIIKAAGVPRSSFPVPYNSFKEQLASKITASSCNNPLQEDETGQGSVTDLEYDFLCFFLSVPRTDLYKQIDQRCEEMLIGSNGLLTEASWLLDMGILPNTNMASRAIGYRHAMEYLSNSRRSGGVSSEKEFYTFLSEFQKASRNFAKRQLTWFRNEPLYHWLDASQPLVKLVNFIIDAYRDSFDVSTYKSLTISKTGSHRELKDLKQYQTQYRHFVNSLDCTHILEWIRLTQIGRS